MLSWVSIGICCVVRMTWPYTLPQRARTFSETWLYCCRQPVQPGFRSSGLKPVLFSEEVRSWLGQSFEPRGCVYVLELTAVCVHAWLSPEGVRTLQSSLVLFFSLLLRGALLRAWICCIGLQRTSFRTNNTCVTQFIKVWKTNNLWSAFLSERAG